MGLAATLNRKRTMEKAAAASAAAVECIDAVNRQAAQITRIHDRTLALEQARTKLDERLDAQGRMILGLEDRLKEDRDWHAGLSSSTIRIADTITGSVNERLRAFERLTFVGRLRWLLTGQMPASGDGVVSADTAPGLSA